MLIKQVDPISAGDLQLQIDLQHGERSEGYHLSRILGDYIWRRDQNDRFEYDPNPGEAVRALWEVGFLWEMCAGKALAERYKLAYPGAHLLTQCELVSDDIYMTPDIINIRDEVIHEFKGTKKSSSHSFSSSKFAHWHMQAKAYCRKVEFNRARFDVLFINGAYEKGVLGDVVPAAWQVEYTDRELKDNWRIIMNHKRFMEKRGIR